MKIDQMPTGTRGHGIDESRYPSDATTGRNTLRRQLDIVHLHQSDSSQAAFQGFGKLRPGIWRLVHGGDDQMATVFSAWFRLNEFTDWNYPAVGIVPGKPFVGSGAEPIPYIAGYREVFVDGDCMIYWCVQRGMYLTAILVSELDEP